MRIIARKHILEFAAKHPLAEPSLIYWFIVTRQAQWQSTIDVVKSFAKAKVINSERVRFTVSGNAYRMVCAFHFPSGTCWIKFLGTHAEYDAVDARTVDVF